MNLIFLVKKYVINDVYAFFMNGIIFENMNDIKFFFVF